MFVWSLLVCFSFAGLAPAQKKKPKAPQLVAVKGTSVSMMPPPGFVNLPQGAGFEHAATKSRIQVIEVPIAMTKFVAGLSKENLQRRGMTVASISNTRVGGFPAKMYQVSQTRGGVSYLTWIGVFGDEKGCIMITASAPMAQKARYSTPLKAAIMSAKWNRGGKKEPAAGLPFSISATANIRYATRMGNSLAYSLNGAFPVKTPGDPLVVIASAPIAVQAKDRVATAERRFRATPGSDHKIEATNTVNIGGLAGVELLGTSKTRSGRANFLYQVLLFDSRGYLLLFGTVRNEDRDRFLPEFQQMARSLRRQ